MAKGTIVAAKAVKREKGKMYFVDGDGNVRSTSMSKGRKAAPKKKTATKKSTAKKSAGSRSRTSKKARAKSSR